MISDFLLVVMWVFGGFLIGHNVRGRVSRSVPRRYLLAAGDYAGLGPVGGKMKLELLRYGDAQGVGAVVKETHFFGKDLTWTVWPGDLDNGFKKWICRETGEYKSVSTSGFYLENFYAANYYTSDIPR